MNKAIQEGLIEVTITVRGTNMGISKNRKGEQKLAEALGSTPAANRVQNVKLPINRLAKIQTELSKARSIFYQYAEPWGRDKYVIATGKFQDMFDALSRQSAIIDQTVQEQFIDDYDQMREEAKVQAKDDWDGDKFPDRADFAGKMGIDFHHYTMTNPTNSILSGITEEMDKRLRGDEAERQQENYEGYIEGLVAQTVKILQDAAGRIAKNTKGTKYANVLDQARQQAKYLRDMNPMGDSERLEVLAEKLENLFKETSVSSDTLRDNRVTRDNTSNGIRNVLEDLDVGGEAPPAPAIVETTPMATPEPEPEPEPVKSSGDTLDDII